MHASADTAVEKEPQAKKTDWLEVSATVLLGLAAVLIAWSAYQAQL